MQHYHRHWVSKLIILSFAPLILILASCSNSATNNQPTQICVSNCTQNNNNGTNKTPQPPVATQQPALQQASGQCPSATTVAGWMHVPSLIPIETCGFHSNGADNAVCPAQYGAVIEYTTNTGILYVTGCRNQDLGAISGATLRLGAFYPPAIWVNPNVWNTDPCTGAEAMKNGSGGMPVELINPPNNVTSCSSYSGITVVKQ